MREAGAVHEGQDAGGYTCEGTKTDRSTQEHTGRCVSKRRYSVAYRRWLVWYGLVCSTNRGLKGVAPKGMAPSFLLQT